MSEHEGKEALRRMVETECALKAAFDSDRQGPLQQVAAYVAELEKGCAIVQDDGSATATLLAAREAEVRHLKGRISELETQMALSDSLLRLLWSWAPALQHRTGCEMAGHPGPGCICTCGRDAVLTQIDEHLERTAPKEADHG